MTLSHPTAKTLVVGALIASTALALNVAPAAAKGKKGPTGDTIIDKMIDEDPFGYGGANARVLMVLVNNRGQQRKRKVIMKSRTDGEVRRNFVRFLAPNDIAGTSFLGIDDDGDRVQHLFLPALSKTRRISASQRNASFVGTDYSYADMDNRDIEDSKRTRLDDDKIGPYETFVVRVHPTSKESKYHHVDVWVEKKSYLPLRMRYFDDKDREIKRFTAAELKKVDGRWIIAESKMVDLKREHSTVLKVADIKLTSDIPLDQFTVRALNRE